jgi:hypothetical protein
MTGQLNGRAFLTDLFNGNAEGYRLIFSSVQFSYVNIQGNKITIEPQNPRDLSDFMLDIRERKHGLFMPDLGRFPEQNLMSLRIAGTKTHVFENGTTKEYGLEPALLMQFMDFDRPCRTLYAAFQGALTSRIEDGPNFSEMIRVLSDAGQSWSAVDFEGGIRAKRPSKSRAHLKLIK